MNQLQSIKNKKGVQVPHIIKTKKKKKMKKITVTANHSKRTFTIRTESSKYITCVFTKEEFEENEMNTSKDWEYFLRTEDFYYLLK